MAEAPATILIIGAGIFGLGTALALLQRPAYANAKIIIVDAASKIPNQHGSSVDASRIVRADYASPVYSRLASEAQVHWRDQSANGWGGGGRYSETGFLLTVEDAQKGEYIKQSMSNVRSLCEEAAAKHGGTPKKIEVLEGTESIMKASGYDEVSGEWGYVNWNSGWSDAAMVVEYIRKRIEEVGGNRVKFMLGEKVEKLLVKGKKVVGARVDKNDVTSDLVVLAAGAWSGSLVDLRGRAVATGQALTYINISQEEERAMSSRPVIMNMSKGMFIIPPKYGQLKMARHGFGYRNPVKVSAKNLLGCDEAENEVEISLPWNGIDVPKEGQEACREALQTLLPKMCDRPFVLTRVCWYYDTPTGDFIIDRHPDYSGIFIATGGSGHGFKFAPIIGEKIVDGIEGKLETDLRTSWAWPKAVPNFCECEDGSRAGAKGMILEQEMARSRKLQNHL